MNGERSECTSDSVMPECIDLDDLIEGCDDDEDDEDDDYGE